MTSESDSVVWQTGTWKEQARFARTEYATVPGPIAFSPDGILLAIAEQSRPTRLTLVDTSRLVKIATLECPNVSVTPESIAFTVEGTALIIPDPRRGHIIYVWDLRELREELDDLGLDWDLPAFPPATVAGDVAPLRAEINLGEFAPSQPGKANGK